MKKIISIRLNEKVYNDYRIWCIKHDQKIGEHLEWLIKKEIENDITELQERKKIGNEIYMRVQDINKLVKTLVYGIKEEQKKNDIQWTE